MTRDEAREMIKEDIRIHHDYLSGTYRHALGMAMKTLLQPEIVRCKDCDFGKHCQNGKHELSIECHNPEKLVVEVHTPEWFCADGWKEGDNG